ncbi:MAG: sulfite exporter TauE/SafE family protein [Nevskia sp.]|nr:sulfite exporter TauE/SafE family protein [Nevskia sp.]
MSLASIAILLTIGLAAGVSSGLFGIGGGVIIVPGLVYLAGMSQHAATGTSLAILLPPIGLAAVLEYHRHGNVDLKTALVVAAAMFVGGWVGAVAANHLSGPQLRLSFGVFIVAMGCYLIFGALRRMALI